MVWSQHSPGAPTGSQTRVSHLSPKALCSQLELERSAWARYSQLNSVESQGLQAQGELLSVPPQCAHGEDEQHNHFGNQVGSFSNS